jgi:hypothetical protein
VSTVKKRASLARTPPHPAQPPSDDENSQSSARAQSSTASRPHNPFQKLSSAAHSKPVQSAHSQAASILSLGSSSQSARGASGPISPQFSRPLARKIARCDNAASGGSQLFAGSQSSQQSQVLATARAPLKQSALSFSVAANRQQLFLSQSQDGSRNSGSSGSSSNDAPSSQLLFSQPMPTPLQFDSARSEPQPAEERQTLSLTQSMGMRRVWRLFEQVVRELVLLTISMYCLVFEC